jgi:mannose-6-phosphate isomerase-like protein (cupin superfamily)
MEKIEKPWGHEIIWAKTDKYVGKILYIKEGHRLSKQYHRSKEETIMVIEGSILLEIGDEESMIRISLKEGMSEHITPGLIHRFSAVFGSDAKIVEVSTPELDDVVRLEDDYNRE